MHDKQIREKEIWKSLDKLSPDLNLGELGPLHKELLSLGVETDLMELVKICKARKVDWRVNPSALASFVTKLFSSREAMRLLASNAGSGWSAAQVASFGHCGSTVAISDDPTAKWLVERIGSSRLSVLEEVPDEKFDAIFSLKPPEAGSEAFSVGDVAIHDSPNLNKMLTVSEHLTDCGLIAWLVRPQFAYYDHVRSVRRNLQQFGLHLTGLLRVPPSMLSTAGKTCGLALVEKQPADQLFVGEIPVNEVAQNEFLERLRQRKSGPQPNQGCLVREEDFHGLEAMEASERVKRLASRRGLVAIPFLEVINEVKRARIHDGESEPWEPHEDAVYLPEIRGQEAATDLQSVSDTVRKRCLQLIANREHVLPEYLARSLNTSLGQAIRDSVSIGLGGNQISRHRLIESTLYLPPIEDQRLALDALDSIQLLRVELEELREQVWESPRKVENLFARLTQVNHEDRFKDWVETLPFPLASVLRAYDAVDRTGRQKYERLLHFFEALAAFVATVHLSAMFGDLDLKKELDERLSVSFKKSHFSWTHPSFGMWRSVIESAAPIIRKMLNTKELMPKIMSLYETADPKPIQFLQGKGLMTVLQKANSLRNRWSGHGGAVSVQIAEQRHAELEGLLTEFRALCGSIFLRYQTIEPREVKVLPGPVFKCPARVIMGSNPQFEHINIKLLNPPVTGALHLHNPGHTRSLQLLSLVQVQKAPQPVCYFYNRQDGSDSHFVSYHYGEQPDSFDQSGSVAELISDLTAKD